MSNKVVKTGLKAHLEQLPEAQALTVAEGLALVGIVNQHARALVSLQNRVSELEERIVELEDEDDEGSGEPEQLSFDFDFESYGLIDFAGLPTIIRLN